MNARPRPLPSFGIAAWAAHDSETRSKEVRTLRERQARLFKTIVECVEVTNAKAGPSRHAALREMKLLLRKLRKVEEQVRLACEDATPVVSLSPLDGSLAAWANLIFSSPAWKAENGNLVLRQLRADPDDLEALKKAQGSATVLGFSTGAFATVTKRAAQGYTVKETTSVLELPGENLALQVCLREPIDVIAPASFYLKLWTTLPVAVSA